MTDEKKLEDMTADEIDAEIKKHLVEKASAYRKEKAKAEELRLKEEDVKKAEEVEAKALEREEAFVKKYNLITPAEPPLGLDGDKKKPEGESDVKDFFRMKDGLMKTVPSQKKFHDAMSKHYGYNEKRVEYASPQFLQGEGAFAFVEADSGCADVITAWSPADIWCDLIWQAAMCGRQLSGVVTLRACDINVGDGLAVQIRAINRSVLTATALGSCQCAVCTSNVFSTYTITLDRLDEYKVLCNLDLWDAGYEIRDAIVQSMANEFIVGIDLRIWNALIGATPGYTETLGASLVCDPAFYREVPEASYSCCSYAANLYREIIQLESRMRTAGYGGEKGFYLIASPTILNYLKWKEGISVPPWMATSIHMDGLMVSSIGNNIKVIEYCGAKDCEVPGGGASDAGTVAVMLDPMRAIGEAYGYKPKFMADEDPIECDSWKLIYRTYVGIDVLDTGAIGHIINP